MLCKSTIHWNLPAGTQVDSPRRRGKNIYYCRTEPFLLYPLPHPLHGEFQCQLSFCRFQSDHHGGESARHHGHEIRGHHGGERDHHRDGDNRHHKNNAQTGC